MTQSITCKRHLTRTHWHRHGHRSIFINPTEPNPWNSHPTQPNLLHVVSRPNPTHQTRLITTRIFEHKILVMVNLLKYQYWYRLQTDSIVLKYSVEVVKAGFQYFTWNYWIIWSCSRLTQPNPTHGNLKNTTQTQPNPTQPNPWVNPTHVHVCVGHVTIFSSVLTIACCLL